jgi:hypothetical protein
MFDEKLNEAELKPRGILKFYEKVCHKCSGFRECFPEPKSPTFNPEIKICIDSEALFIEDII